MIELPTNQEFIEKVALLIVGAVLTGILVPVLKVILDSIKFRKQKLFEHELARQKGIIESQINLLENMSRLLWQYHALIAKVSYYSKEGVSDDEYKNAIKEYENNFWNIVIVDVQAEISKARRLTSKGIYEELRTFYKDTLISFDKELVGLVKRKAQKNDWENFHEKLKDKFVNKLDITLKRLADDMGLAVDSIKKPR